MKKIIKQLKKIKRREKMKKKKKKKYTKWIDNDTFLHLSEPSTTSGKECIDNIPKQMCLNVCTTPGIYFGRKIYFETGQYAGLSQGKEGNVLIIGGNGSGKSAGIAKPTLYTWRGTMCVTDIKGELSDFYTYLHQHGIVERPYKVFNPMQMNGIGYDPFHFLKQDGEVNLINNIREITLAIIPTPHDIKEPFWIESEQNIFTAALLYGFQLGLSFKDTIIKITSSTVSELITDILNAGNKIAKIILGDTLNLKTEILADIDRGLRNKLMVFAIDPYISNAFHSMHEDTDCITWDDLDKYNIFLRIPADKIDQWSGVINLMYTQLIHHLERRPEKYSSDGKNSVPTLLLMDEFARFGKLNIITNAVSTLRSKNVNICLFIQSLAQLDKIYGVDDRRIILDNCQYKAILQANDADTQEYFSRLIGTHINTQRSRSENMDAFMDTVGYSNQSSEIRERIIFPHELSTLSDILLLSPYGFCRIDKMKLYNIENFPLISDRRITYAANSTVIIAEPETSCNENYFNPKYLTNTTVTTVTTIQTNESETSPIC